MAPTRMVYHRRCCTNILTRRQEQPQPCPTSPAGADIDRISVAGFASAIQARPTLLRGLVMIRSAKDDDSRNRICWYGAS